jgi:hypothetical protein
MRIYLKFKRWIGKKMIDKGFDILLSMDEKDWNPKTNKYSGSIKQVKYAIGFWMTTLGIKAETKALDKLNWPGFEDGKYFDKNFYIKKPIRKPRRKPSEDSDNEPML